MNKGELIHETALRVHTSDRSAELIINKALEIAAHELSRGEPVTLAGFGVLRPRWQDSQPGRGALRGRPSPAGYRVRFTMAAALARRLSRRWR